MNVVVYSPHCTVSILHVSLSLYNLACCADGGGTSFNPLSRLIHRKSASVRPSARLSGRCGPALSTEGWSKFTAGSADWPRGAREAVTDSRCLLIEPRPSPPPIQPHTSTSTAATQVSPVLTEHLLSHIFYMFVSVLWFVWLNVIHTDMFNHLKIE